jgi:hypothetical protein
MRISQELVFRISQGTMNATDIGRRRPRGGSLTRKNTLKPPGPAVLAKEALRAGILTKFTTRVTVWELPL